MPIKAELKKILSLLEGKKPNEAVAPDELAKTLGQSEESESGSAAQPASVTNKITSPNDLDQWITTHPGRIPKEQVPAVKQLVELYFTDPNAYGDALKDTFMGRGLLDLYEALTGKK